MSRPAKTPPAPSGASARSSSQALVPSCNRPHLVAGGVEARQPRVDVARVRSSEVLLRAPAHDHPPGAGRCRSQNGRAAPGIDAARPPASAARIEVGDPGRAVGRERAARASVGAPLLRTRLPRRPGRGSNGVRRPGPELGGPGELLTSRSRRQDDAGEGGHGEAGVGGGVDHDRARGGGVRGRFGPRWGARATVECRIRAG